MEKILYTLWKPADCSADTFRDRLLGVMPALQQSGARQLRLCVADSAVEPAAGLRQSSGAPAPDALLTLWVDTAIQRARQEEVFKPHCAEYHAYLVTESEPMAGHEQPPTGADRRTPGMNQIAFLKKPARLTYEQWIDIWHHSHAQIAVETQSTFGYRQNVVARPLNAGAPHWDAMVEENFPAAAMTSQQAFYAAEGDEELYQRNLQIMMDSCKRFIDFGTIDVIVTSEYRFD